MPILPFKNSFRGFLFDEDELYISMYYSFGQPTTRFDFEWWELAMVEDFLELPFVRHWNQLEEERKVTNFEELMELPFQDATDNDILGIPDEDWDKELEEEERMKHRDAAENLVGLRELPFYEVTYHDLLGIPEEEEEDWDKEIEEERRVKDASFGRRG